jgi:hypothetical protein
MDNPFLCGSDYLNKHWRILRAQLTSDKLDLEHLEIVVKFWSKAPISAPYLDWDRPDNWADPWEFVTEMNFDESGIAIGMEYSLLLAEDHRWASDRLHLSLIASSDGSKQLLVLVVDNTYVLNYSYGVIMPFDQASNELVIQQEYVYSNKMHKIQRINLS